MLNPLIVASAVMATGISQRVILMDVKVWLSIMARIDIQLLTKPAACDCNTDGSILTNSGLPLCDKDTGQCLCREGAMGDQCEACMVG